MDTTLPSNKSEVIELAQKAPGNLITSQEEIQNINQINQAINQVAEELQELFTITPYATLPPKKAKIVSFE